MSIISDSKSTKGHIPEIKKTTTTLANWTVIIILVVIIMMKMMGMIRIIR